MFDLVIHTLYHFFVFIVDCVHAFYRRETSEKKRGKLEYLHHRQNLTYLATFM